jgi:hypothetical protein
MKLNRPADEHNQPVPQSELYGKGNRLIRKFRAILGKLPKDLQIFERDKIEAELGQIY